MTTLADVFAKHEGLYAAQVVANTFGHLEPKAGNYKCWIIFCVGCFQSSTEIVNYNIKKVNDCPGVCDDLWEFVNKKCMNRGAGVYKFVGEYTRFKKGTGRFTGKVKKVKIV